MTPEQKSMYYRDFAKLKGCGRNNILRSISDGKLNAFEDDFMVTKGIKRYKIRSWFVILDKAAELYRKYRKIPEGWVLKSELEKEYDQRHFSSFHYNCKRGNIKAEKVSKYETGGYPVWIVELKSWKKFVNGSNYIPDVMGNLHSYWAEERRRESLNNYK